MNSLNNDILTTNASVSLLQNKPTKQFHSNFHIPEHLKKSQMSQGLDGSFMIQQSYDKIDHRSLNQFQLFNLRSSKNSKGTPGNIYMANVNAGNAAIQIMNTSLDQQSYSGSTQKRFPTSTKAVSGANRKSKLQVPFAEQRSQSIEKMIKLGDRPDVTGITGVLQAQKKPAVVK